MTETLKIQLALEGLKNVQAGLNSIGGTLRGVVGGVAGIAAALAGSKVIQEFQRITEEMVKMTNASQTFGVSTEFLSGFGYAAKVAGVEQAKLGEAMKGFIEKSRAQGGVVGDLGEALMRQADIFARLPDGPQKAALAMQTFGEAGLAIIPVLNKGGDGIRELTDEARQFGIVIDGDAAKAAKALKQDLERLNAASEGLKVALVSGLTPALADMAKIALASITTVSGADSAITKFAKSAGAYVGYEFNKMARTITFAGAGVAESLEQIFSPDKEVSLAGILNASKKAAEEFDAKLRKLREPIKQLTEETNALVAATNYLARARANASAMLDIRGITAQGDNTPDVIKRAEARAVAAQRMAAVNKQISDLQATAPKDQSGFIGPDGRMAQTEETIRYQEQHIALMREQATVQAEMNQLGGTETSMVWTQTMLDIQNQWGSWSAQLATGFAGVFNTAISTISTNITGLIMQTKTWGQALASIGNTILTTVIQSIIEMGVRWVLTRAMVGLANIAWSGKEAIAAAPKAMMESISSYGVAALLGGAAFAGIMAAVGGFSEGGFTGNMAPTAPAGIVHGREFVMSAPATSAIGLDTLTAMNQSGEVPAAAVAMPSASREQRIVIVDDARTVQDLQNDPAFETMVVNLMGRNAWRLR